MKNLVCAVFAAGFLLLAGGYVYSDDDDDKDTLVRFKAGIGVIPVSNVTVAGTPPVVTVSPNIVRGVNPAG